MWYTITAPMSVCCHLQVREQPGGPFGGRTEWTTLQGEILKVDPQVDSRAITRGTTQDGAPNVALNGCLGEKGSVGKSSPIGVLGRIVRNRRGRGKSRRLRRLGRNRGRQGGNKKSGQHLDCLQLSFRCELACKSLEMPKGEKRRGEGEGGGERPRVQITFKM